jgi:ABC-type multidrug transport system fused ATPase/permease subunit
MSESIALDLRNDFFKNVMAKDIGFFDSNRSGDLGKLKKVSRLNNDIAVV